MACARNSTGSTGGDRIRILEKQLKTLPRCERCGSQVPEGRLDNRNYASEKYNQGEERSIRLENFQRCFESSMVSFQIKAYTLPPLEAFPYVGRTIAYNNSDWAVVYLNLHKA